MKFELATPTRIVFGEGTFAQVGAIADSLGRRALVVHGASDRAAVRATRVDELLAASGVAHAATLRVPGEPTVSLIEEGVRAARDARSDVVIAVGGGSVIDAAKACAALLTNPGEPLDYLEIVGRGRAIAERAAPMIAVPTTAGTGAEVTRNAVLMVESARVKASMRNALMMPAVALVDPELTYDVPPDITASTGLDALTQCLEPFVTPQANPLTDAFAREGMTRAARSLARAVDRGDDVDARRDMAIASLCGGLALANAKLGAVHGFAAPLGGMFPIPHGVACARLLAPIASANVRALAERAADAPALARYDEAARLLTGRADARAAEVGAWLAGLVESLNVQRLGAYGLRHDDVIDVCAQARRASSMQGNPIVLTDDELAEALRAAI